jgi:hypothetical protein
MTKGLYGGVQRYSVVFQPCYLKTLDEIRAALPKRPLVFQMTPEFQSEEEATCWGIAARMRQNYLLSKYSNEDHDLRDLAFKLSIRVYALGPAPKPGSRFSEWFAQANAPRYRILISTSPNSYGAREFSCHIGPHSSDRPRLITVPKDHLTTEERRTAKAFLTEFAEAAWFGKVARDDLLEKTGHPYWSSDGKPVPLEE